MADPIRPELERLAAADLIRRVEALEQDMKAKNTPSSPPPVEIHDGKRRSVGGK